MRRFATAGLGAIPLLLPGSGLAIDLQTLVAPGPVIEGHADVEADCQRCHRPFERASEGDLCLGCHEAVAADLKAGKGFHGLQPAATGSTCRSCHTEHLGRDADIVGLDVETFDHGSTDFPLRGAHQRSDCADCHPPDRGFRDAPDTCVACHAADDPHQGRLGEDCSKCHSESAWRDARFDHARTDFPLDGAHVRVACAVCHPAQRYDGTPTGCRDCHAVDDVHRGRFGAGCRDCHGTADWKRGAFDHDARTRFPLRGRHRDASCASCHGKAANVGMSSGGAEAAGEGRAGRLDMRCIGCHRADDEHRGNFGAACETCHDSAAWKSVDFDHARDAKFALEGAHRGLSCSACHRGDLREEALPRDCSGCHAADDVHRGHEGNRCESCHDSASWTQRVSFDHELTRFPLLGLHGVVPCEECHRTLAFQDAPTDCDACHARQDVHERSLGTDCAICHNPNGWPLWRFDHATQTRFPLHGAHEKLDCRGCHDSPAERGIERETRCESCHGMEDPHRGSFGVRCGDCHLEASWKELRIGR